MAEIEIGTLNSPEISLFLNASNNLEVQDSDGNVIATFKQDQSSEFSSVNTEETYNDEESSLDISEAWWATFSQSIPSHIWFFESLDGMSETTSGSGSISLGMREVTLSTGSTSGSHAQLKDGIRSTIPTDSGWNKDRRIAFGCRPTTADADTYAVLGEVIESDKTLPHLGFVWTGGSLKGTVADGSAQNTTTLDSNPTTGSDINVFAEYEVGTEVRFWHEKDPNSNSPDGTLTSNIPSSGDSRNERWSVLVENSSSTDRNFFASEVRWGVQP